MRIALVLNKADRELPIMEKIKGWLIRLAPRTQVLIVDFHDPLFHVTILEFAPDAVLTFPFTVAGLSARFYLIKYLLNCCIVCFRTEGAIDFTSDKQLRWLAGMDRYGSDLVDHELFWGPKTAQVVGATLLKQGKLSSLERTRSLGYPNFESYLGEGAAEAGELPAQLAERLSAAGPAKTLFFITGFHLADYTPQDLVNAGDILRRDDPAFEREFQEALQGVERARQFRQLWIERIIQAAQESPEALFVVKCHPIETEIHFRQHYPNPYLAFQGHSNVVYLTENVPVGAILPHCSLFFHYGSTCVAESYLLQVPSVFLTSREIYRGGTPSVYDYADLGWPATLQADILELPELVRRHLREPFCFDINRAASERVLQEVFNVERAHLEGSTAYLPSRDLALFLLDLADQAPQRLAPKDPYLLQACQVFSSQTLNALGERGTAAEAAGKTLKALGIFNQMSRLAELAGRREPDLEYLRALCLSRLGCHGFAREIVKEVLLQAPGHPQAAELQKMLAPQGPGAQRGSAELPMLRYDGHPQRLVQALEEADAAGAPALAEALCRAALAEGESPQALARLALAEAQRGESEQALRRFSRALALDPAVAESGRELLALLVARGLHREADRLRSSLYLVLEQDPRYQEELKAAGYAEELARFAHGFQQLRPKVFMIETSLACDLRCPECAIGGKLIGRRPGFMSLDRFREIVDKIAPYAEYLYLHIWGEPMLNPEIIPMIRYASARARTNISTNGMSLTEGLAEELIASGVGDLLVSIDGVSQESYGHYRVGGEVAQAFAALEMLQRANLRHGGKVAIRPQFIVFRHNQHEMEQFRERCQALGLEPVFKAPYLRASSRFEPGDDPLYQRPHYRDLETLRQAMAGCPDPREVCTILNDGSMVACCYDHNGATCFGSIYQHDLMELWNSHRCRQFRWELITGNAPGFCQENCMSYFLEQQCCGPATAGDRPDPVAQPVQALSGDAAGAAASRRQGGRRQRQSPAAAAEPGELLAQARDLFAGERYNEAFDLYEHLAQRLPAQRTQILAEVYDRYQALPDQESRYHLYVSRFFDFGFEPGDKVLDIGSGHLPFPFATHLADLSLSDGSVGRAGVPFRYLDGKPVYECGVEQMPFADKEFDFVYCSHVLEHAEDPEQACRELMRVARRGYIETPTRGKDLWLDTAKLSNHRWAVEWSHDTLIFSEYTPEEIEGLSSEILLNMHCAPQSEREKAFSALIYLKANLVNTMVYWEDSFKFEVRRAPAAAAEAHVTTAPATQPAASAAPPADLGSQAPEKPRPPALAQETPLNPARPQGKPHCVFLNTYYGAFLQNFYGRNPHLFSAGYAEQQQALEAECFGDSNFYSDGMIKAGWRATDLIINCNPLQQAWAREHGCDADGEALVLEQLRRLAPEAVYIQDMHVMSAEFLKALRPLTRLIVGQIASPFGPHIPLELYDIVFTSFPHFVERFRQLGATAYYQPLAFEPRVLQAVPTHPWAARPVDCSFVGGISPLHTAGTALLETLVELSPIRLWGYGAENLPEGSSLRARHGGETWGREMFGTLASSRITVNRHVDVAEEFANNMRLFEATGCGALLITDYKENLNGLFEIGKEVVAYRSAEECAALINYYLAHPEEAQAIARAGQRRTLRDHCYSRRLEQTAEILQRHLLYQDEEQRLPPLDLSKISFGHAAIDSSEVTKAMTCAWQDGEIPARQRALVQKELEQMYRGQAAPAFQVLAQILRPHLRPGTPILEIGCASGYYYEILEYLLQHRIDYTGVDYSQAMIDMAQGYYPKGCFFAADGASLFFADRQFHTVISSCVLLHVPNYREHIVETARVADRFVVAARTPICKRRPTQYLKKFAYGVETVELVFNEEELIAEFALNRFQLAQAIQYQAEPAADLYQTTYLFKRA